MLFRDRPSIFNFTNAYGMVPIPVDTENPVSCTIRLRSSSRRVGPDCRSLCSPYPSTPNLTTPSLLSLFIPSSPSSPSSSIILTLIFFLSYIPSATIWTASCPPSSWTRSPPTLSWQTLSRVPTPLWWVRRRRPILFIISRTF